MLHAMFQDHRTSGSGEEDFQRIFKWWPSWSCDLDHLYRLSFPIPKEAPHEIWHCFAKRFKRRRYLKIMVIYMYIALEQGQTTPRGHFFFINIIIQSILSFAASFHALNDFVTVFPM